MHPLFLYKRIKDWIVCRSLEYIFVYQRLLALNAAKRSGADEQYWTQVLRMNAHFLDKGNCRVDSEPGHAQEPYRIARAALNHLPDEWLEQDPSLQWARTVLRRYEDLQRGESLQLSDPVSNLPPDTPDLLRAVILGRRSIRRFLERSVTKNKLQEVMSVINWAPSSCNRQPIVAFASIDPEIVTKCVSTCKGATGFGTFVPCFIAFCADLRTYTFPREIWMPYIDVALGVQNCCLMAYALGMSITLLSWAHHNEEEEDLLRTSLEIPQSYEIVVNGVLGYPEHGMEPPLRKAKDCTLFIR